MSQRELEYVGRSRRDLEELPEDVQELVAFALLEAIVGSKHQDIEQRYKAVRDLYARREKS